MNSWISGSWSRLGKTLALLIALTLISTGCERTPEDVEKWRDAQGGTKKMLSWVESTEEPLPVRQKSAQILVEQDEADKLQQIFDDMQDEATRQKIVDSTAPVIEAMWKKQDQPKMTKDLKEKGGQVEIKVSEAVMAKDAAYYLYPYASEAVQKQFETILGEWMSSDFQLRDQLGKTTLQQLLPRAGTKGMESMMVWFESHKTPAVLAQLIRKEGDDKTRAAFAKKVVEILNKQHPEIDPQMRAIMLETKDPVIVSYVKRVLKDPKSPAPLAADAIDTLVNVEGIKATNFLLELIESSQGLMRWACITQLIALRGEAGVMQAANALPLEPQNYIAEGKETLQRNSIYFCNLLKSELLEKDKVKSLDPLVKKLLSSSRWPVQALGVRCVEEHKLKDLVGELEPIQDNKQELPGWQDNPTLGDFAEEVAKKF